MADQVKVTGLRELGEAFDLALPRLERRALTNATKAGGKVLEDGVQRRVPKGETGDLAANITVKMTAHPGKGIVTAVIGVIYRGIRARFSRRKGKAPSSEDPGVYAQFVEFGRPNKEGHTHQAARPFMRPTFDQDSDAAVKAFADKLESQLGDLVS